MSVFVDWLNQAAALAVDEEIYIPTAHKAEQKDFFRDMRAALSNLRKIDPVGGAQIRIYMTFKDKQYWVVLKKVRVSPLVGFKKDANGVITKIQIKNKELERIEKLKREDVC